MRYKKRKKAASQVMAMAVLVVAVLAVLFVLASSLYVFMMRTVNSKFIRTHPACHISEMFIADMTEA